MFTPEILGLLNERLSLSLDALTHWRTPVITYAAATIWALTSHQPVVHAPEGKGELTADNGKNDYRTELIEMGTIEKLVGVLSMFVDGEHR